MIQVANESTETTSKPSMDRLTHAVLKETSKTLKYYMDVKRRENAFVLDANLSACDVTPLKGRFISGAKKEQPSFCSSFYTDKDLKHTSSSFQQKQRQFNTSLTSPEKQMCREELHFHMRSFNFSSKDNPKMSEHRLRSTIRSSSLCPTKRDIRLRSACQLTRHEQDQLIDNTANILALMVKTRRSFHEANSSTQQTSPICLSRIPNPSPHHSDHQSNIQSPITSPTTDLRMLTKATSIMRNSKAIKKGILCKYKISIITGNCNGASTNASIRIKFHGTNGHTNFYELVHSETHHVPFLKDQTDIFILATYHVGELVGITIGHDRKDMSKGASWFLSKISIDDTIRHITYDIPCNAWLSSKSNDQKTMRHFQVVSMVSHKENMKLNENRSQSDYSTVSNNGTLTSNASILSKNKLLTDHEQSKNSRKQRRVSIGPTIIAKEPLLISINTNKLSPSLPPPPTTTCETHCNQNEESPFLPALLCRLRSPNLSTNSSDKEIEDNMTSRTRTPSPTMNQTCSKSVIDHETFQRYSIDYDRPSTQLEQKSASLFVSSEQPNKKQEEDK